MIILKPKIFYDNLESFLRGQLSNIYRNSDISVEVSAPFSVVGLGCFLHDCTIKLFSLCCNMDLRIRIDIDADVTGLVGIKSPFIKLSAVNYYDSSSPDYRLVHISEHVLERDPDIVVALAECIVDYCKNKFFPVDDYIYLE